MVLTLEALGQGNTDEGINNRHLGSVLAVILRSGRSGKKGEASERAKNRPVPTAYKGHSSSGAYFSAFLDPHHPLSTRCVPQHASPGSF